MLFIVGGAARSGKSIVARKFLSQTGIPYFSLDFLMMGLANGVPQLGVNPEAPTRLNAEKLWPVVRAMGKNVVEVGLDYLFEGDSIFPMRVSDLVNEYPGKVRACFVGYTEISAHAKLNEIREFAGHPNDWVSDYTDEEVLKLIDEMIDYSRHLKRECIRLNIPYFDQSESFANTVEAVLSYLKDAGSPAT